jgi:heme-degrading monooxygenase HmoA
MSLTVLEARSPEEIQEIRSRTRNVVSDLLGTPGFISWLGVVVDNRMYTITAWDDADAVRRLQESPAHSDAMRRFFAAEPEGVAAGGQTGVWSPHRLNGMWVRCAACGRMVRPRRGGACPCGAELSPPRYW